ncbi:LOG family protein [Chloroflexota bacterium]
MKISVFGGSSPTPGSTAYIQAFSLGRNLALSGHTVLTGGYIGTMEAVSRGASEAGGHVIGVTCTQIESWRQIKANSWVKEEILKASLQERLTELIENCDACMALPGGPGTLTEIGLAWNLMIIKAIPSKPLILIGKEWIQVITKFFESFDEYIKPSQRDLILFANNVQQAITLLKNT